MDLQANKYYSIKQVADFLNLTTRTIWNYIKSEKLETIKIGNTTRISGSSIIKMINK